MRDQMERFLRSLTLGELSEAREFVEELLQSAETASAEPLPSQGAAAERRRASRYALNLPVTYFRHRTGGPARPPGSGVQHAVVRDISRGGIRLLTTEPLVPDEVLTVYLPGPLGVRKLFVDITHVHQRGDRYECGAAFVGFGRVYHAHKTEARRAQSARVLVACEPGADRNALSDLLAKEGYVAIVANSVPEACQVVQSLACSPTVVDPAMLLAEDGRLLRELKARENDVLSIAFISSCGLDLPENEPLRRCDDLLCAPPRSEEVRSILGRAFQRLVARRARRSAAPPP